MTRFNYIVTCHNPEALIERVLLGVMTCRSRADSLIYCMLDGCTDGTRKKIENYRDKHDLKCLYIFETPDVHELLTINAGLSLARGAGHMEGHGYNIILQDDVVLEEPDLEAIVSEAYAQHPYLGYLSFRLGFNLGPDDPSNPYLIQCDEIESLYGAACAGATLWPYRLAWRAVVIKSPVCLPFFISRDLGYDPALAPYGYDDVDMSLISSSLGYRNAVLSIPFQSDVRWGGTRRKDHPDIQPVVRRNAAYLRKMWDIRAGVGDRGQAMIRPATPKQDAHAAERWAQSQRVLRSLNP